MGRRLVGPLRSQKSGANGNFCPEVQNFFDTQLRLPSPPPRPSLRFSVCVRPYSAQKVTSSGHNNELLPIPAVVALLFCLGPPKQRRDVFLVPFSRPAPLLPRAPSFPMRVSEHSLRPAA